MLHAIIMAGGSGTRLWPESTKERPKQFLTFQGNKSMIQMTVDRLFGLVDSSRIIIATGETMIPLVQEALPLLRHENFLPEPTARNTAPCIGLAAIFLLRNDPDATMVVLPADQIIEPASVFRDTVRFALELVEESPEKLITLGILPTFPATSYGYIEAAEKWETETSKKWSSLAHAHAVSRFHEKPDAKTAKMFVESGRFRWNAGIFIWKARRILELIETFEPEIGKHLQNIAKSINTPDFPSMLKQEFEAMKSVSIDYAVLEHAPGITCIDAPFAWDDVGTWQALDRLNQGKHDANGNLADHCDLIAIDASNNIVRSDDPTHKIALVGVENLIVIQTKTGTLIAHKDQEEKIRSVTIKQT